MYRNLSNHLHFLHKNGKIEAQITRKDFQNMKFLQFLEGIRTPFGNTLMSAITLLGEETLFIVLALVFFWCIDKKRGYYLLFSCFAGTVCIQFLKMIFRIPRPWVSDPNFKIVESAREAATGYSFPSGHTQCAAGLFGGIACSAKKRAVQIGCVVIVLLVGLSRMYLGVHTPLDVFVSLGIAILILFTLYHGVYRGFDKPKQRYLAGGVLLAVTVANLLFVMLYQFPIDVPVDQINHAQESAWQMLALAIGLCIIYPIDRYWIRFETKAVWWAQILKLIIGVGLVLVVRYLLKSPINSLFGANIGKFVRYFLIVTVAGILWPMTFKFWSKLGQKKEDAAE